MPSLRAAGFVASIGAVVALAVSGPAVIGGLDDPRQSSSLTPELRSPDFDLAQGSVGSPSDRSFTVAIPAERPGRARSRSPR